MKKIFLTFCALLATATLFAKPVDATTARRVAENFMRLHGMANPAMLEDISGKTPYTAFYVFAAKEGGFVLVSGDDCVVPVLGYSADDLFDWRDIPAHVDEWLRGYEEEIERVKASTDNAAAEGGLVAQLWDDLGIGVAPEPLLTASVDPLLTTTWNQSPYYNNLCPLYTANNSRSVTGCVATATAQVMKYHNHPATGYGSYTYNSETTENGVTYTFNNLSANFGATTYQWNDMPNALTGSSSNTEVNAVATLIYHVGVAAGMKYSPVASGTHNYNYNGSIQPSSQTALMAYFKYRPDMAVLARADYSDEEFSAMLRNEIDQQRPILYSGSNIEAGHSFVLDGYDNSNRFHINWGWGGSHNGYFAMGSINPGIGGIGGNSSGTYNQENIALTGIRPNTNWSTAGGTTVTTSTVGTGQVEGAGGYAFGDTMVVRARATAGYRFDRWSDGTKFNPRQMIATGGNYSFTALFVPIDDDTVFYCPGNKRISSYGVVGSDTTVWGIHIPAADLTQGMGMTGVQLYISYSGTYHYDIYTGANHGTLALSGSAIFGSNDVGGWQTIALPSMLTTTEDIWILLTSDASYPASYSYYGGRNEGAVWGRGFSETGTAWNISFMVKGLFQPIPMVDDQCLITTFPYTMDFENGAPCWTARNNNQDSITWRIIGGYGHNGSACAYVSFAEQADDWLISPLIATPDSYELNWKVRARDASYPETYQVWGVSNDSTIMLFSETTTDTLYVDHTVYFSVASGDTSYILFRYVSDDMYALFIDDVVIRHSTTEPQPIQYTIGTASNDGAMGTVSGGGTYDEGSVIVLTATPHDGYRFVRWHDGNSTNPRNVTVTADATYTAIFEAIPPAQYTITVNSNNVSWGTASGSGIYTEGTTAALTATPADGYRFVRWHDGNTSNPRNVTVTANATYTAIFEAIPPAQYTITANSNNDSWGTVSGSGLYTEGTTATLTATPTDGYRFAQWQDGSDDNPRNVTVTANTTYTATFEAIAPVGIGDDAAATSWTLQPNPASSVAILAGLPGEGRVVMTDAVGRAVATYDIDGTTLEISVGRLAPGTYILTLQTSNGNSMQKLIVR